MQQNPSSLEIARQLSNFKRKDKHEAKVTIKIYGTRARFNFRNKVCNFKLDFACIQGSLKPVNGSEKGDDFFYIHIIEDIENRMLSILFT